MATEQMEKSSPETKLHSMQEAIKIMGDVSARYRLLVDESDEALNRQNRKEYQAKSKEAANLLISLPDQLKEILSGVDEKFKYSILRQTEAFASVAKKLLATNSFAGMSAILNSMGDNINDKNHLEKLIDELRQMN
jgi:hypothetical protein